MNEHNEHIGRNDPCWCGSGKKFKKCHLNRADQPKIPISEVLSESKKAFSSKYCLHPDKSCCSGNIILAHTIHAMEGLPRSPKMGRC